MTDRDAFVFKPIGYLQSPFAFKNGTPRQATVCKQARGIITIDKSVFNNPEHSLEGLEEFSHVWIFFVFHKNNNPYSKAKVQPPRLNGGKVGLFSTRSPYRPNNIGLTLAKIENIKGATVTVSGIDILDGTPVIDLKPYIPQYDCPYSQTENSVTDINEEIQETPRSDIARNSTILATTDQSGKLTDDTELVQTESEEHVGVLESHQTPSKADIPRTHEDLQESGSDCPIPGHNKDVDPSYGSAHEVSENLDLVARNESSVICSKEIVQEKLHSSQVVNDGIDKDKCPRKKSQLKFHSVTQVEECYDDRSKTSSETAEWINRPPVSTLTVRFTQTAVDQLKLFSATAGDVQYRLKFMKTNTEARDAIVNILCEDPRSVYRRNRCVDSLYYFTVDILHVTCWFDDEDVVEVVRLKPACNVEQCKHGT